MTDNHRTGESDVARDDKQALLRPAGGEPMDDAPDGASTTGPAPSGEFVGRVAGQDVGYAGTTGAEARAAADGDELPGP